MTSLRSTLAAASLALFAPVAAHAQVTGGTVYIAPGSTVGGNVSAIGVAGSVLKGSVVGTGNTGIFNNNYYNGSTTVNYTAATGSSFGVVFAGSGTSGAATTTINGNVTGTAVVGTTATDTVIGYSNTLTSRGTVANDTTRVNTTFAGSFDGGAVYLYSTNVGGDAAATGAVASVLNSSAVGSGNNATVVNPYSTASTTVKVTEPAAGSKVTFGNVVVDAGTTVPNGTATATGVYATNAEGSGVGYATTVTVVKPVLKGTTKIVVVPGL